MSSETVTLLVGAGTIIGALIGIFFTALLSRASITSTLRQDWINSLRVVLSKYLTHAEKYIDIPDKNSEEAYWAKIDLLESMHQAKLYLNESEDNPKDLMKIMEELPVKYAQNEYNSRTYQEEKPQISSLMQTILKDEWNRVRDGEILWSVNNLLKLVGLPSWFYISRIRLFWLIVLLLLGLGIYEFGSCAPTGA